LIDIRNISKSYNKGAVRAVDGLDLRVEKGEIFGFLGPNGAGKTTTIKMIVGLLNPDEGDIIIDGTNIRDNPIEAKKKLGYVPDNPNLYDRLTGVEYLKFMADIYRVPPGLRKERIEHYLGMFELKDAASDLIKSYSHGMKQKIAIAGALIHDPDVWILDEPMVGLDPKSSHLLKSEMREHCDRGKTVFFSTHILEVAERLCDRVGIIHKGKLIAVGTIDELKQGVELGGKESLENIFLEMTEK
jgi:ABC-2 type transport system ATP-binding protein